MRRLVKARALRILYLSPYWPHGATYASEIRALNVARVLRECGRLEVVVVGGEGAGEEWMASPDKEFEVACSFPMRSQARQGFR
jgi:hypothetical protein